MSEEKQSPTPTFDVLVIGAGLAGSEASYALAREGYKVALFESKRKKLNPAQKTTNFCELVCTNSLKSIKTDTGHGVLKYEMGTLKSLVLDVAYKTAVPAGETLCVDRERFSKGVTEALVQHPLITILEEEVENPLALQQKYQARAVIVATGPLTTEKLSQWIKSEISEDDLYFYDAIAPILDAETLDFKQFYHKDRYVDYDPTKDGDNLPHYVNIPLNREQYFAFVEALREAETVNSHDFEEDKFFESCLPIDVMAQRGLDTLRFSCMRPVGLEMPNGEIPFAAIQLRRENLLGSAYNMVGFQTRMTYGAQKALFRTLPGLEKAEFLHLGQVHRNTFLNAKKTLKFDMSSLKHENLFFAGQITGVEGYTESAMSGLYVAHQLCRRFKGQEPMSWPHETATGALVNYLMTAERPAPVNVNFGLFPTITKENMKKYHSKKSMRRALMGTRAFTAMNRLRAQESFNTEG